MTQSRKPILRAIVEHAQDKGGMFDMLECGHAVRCSIFGHELRAGGAGRGPASRRCTLCAAPEGDPDGDSTVGRK